MKAIKVADATPRQIDWLVAKCEGLNPNTDPERRRQFVGYPGFAEANGFGYGIKQYSTDWAHGGPIITREKISIQRGNDLVFPRGNEHGEFAEPLWLASIDNGAVLHGQTPLIAAMRCYCAKLGEFIDIPEELCQQESN